MIVRIDWFDGRSDIFEDICKINYVFNVEECKYFIRLVPLYSSNDIQYIEWDMSDISTFEIIGGY